MNLLQETLLALSHHGKRPSDVQWVGDSQQSGTWADFESVANFEYANDQVHDDPVISPELKVVGAGWWLERIASDGSEWWEYKTIPTKPRAPMPLNELQRIPEYDD